MVSVFHSVLSGQMKPLRQLEEIYHCRGHKTYSWTPLGFFFLCGYLAQKLWNIPHSVFLVFLRAALRKALAFKKKSQACGWKPERTLERFKACCLFRFYLIKSYFVLTFFFKICMTWHIFNTTHNTIRTQFRTGYWVQ